MPNESLSKEIAVFIMEFITAVKDKSLSWKEDSQERVSNLQKKQQISLVEIKQTIERAKIDFENEIAESKAEFDTKMKKLKLKHDQDLRDYDRFLKNITKLRDDLKEFYPDMPDILLDIIHDYAKELFFNMWETSDPREKLDYKREYIRFLVQVSEDTNPSSLTGNSNCLPQGTIKHIESSNSY